MSDYEWLDIYRQADDEQDISKLHQRVMDAESAIFARMQQLSEGPQSEIDVQTETLAMRSALNGLLRIKTVAVAGIGRRARRNRTIALGTLTTPGNTPIALSLSRAASVVLSVR
jgi:hypothetical protein